jgi:hypothetical protein
LVALQWGCPEYGRAPTGSVRLDDAARPQLVTQSQERAIFFFCLEHAVESYGWRSVQQHDRVSYVNEARMCSDWSSDRLTAQVNLRTAVHLRPRLEDIDQDL